VKWYRLAACEGSAPAHVVLGGLFSKSTGVLDDPVLALIWCRISNANGFDTATGFRDQLEAQMTAEQIADATRRARVCADANYADCK